MFRKDELIPDWIELVSCGVLSVIILMVANLDYATDRLLADVASRPESLSAVGGQYVHQVARFIDEMAFVPHSTVFVFWSLAGLAIFSLLQSFYSLYREVRDNIEISTSFLHPSHWVRWRFWLDIVLRFIAQTGLYLVSLAWGLLIGYVFIPHAIVAVRGWVDHPAELVYFGAFLAGFILLYIGILVLGMLLKFLLKRKQIII